MKRFLVLALCALFACQAEARTLYVNSKRPNNKGNALSPAKAKKTIQAAVNIAKKGDTILVYPGTYAPIKTNNKKVTIKSVKGRARTKIVKPAGTDRTVALAQLGKPYSVYLDTDYTRTSSSGIWTKGTRSRLSGFTLDGKHRAVGSSGELIGISGGIAKSCLVKGLGKRYAATDGGVPQLDYAKVAVNANLQDCTIQCNHGRLAPEEWMAASGGKTAPPTGSKFLRCKIRNNELYLGCQTCVLANCLVEGNTVQGDLFFSSSLLNCTVAKNTVRGPWSDPSFSTASKYVNCILWSNWLVPPKETRVVYGYHYYDADGNFIGYRPAGETSFSVDVWDAYGTYTSIEVTEATLSDHCPGWTKSEESYTETSPGTVRTIHNVDPGNTYKYTDKTNKNPKFTSAYKLKKGSYAINKGKLTKAQKKLVGAKDLAGNKRIKGKAVDRGCYER